MVHGHTWFLLGLYLDLYSPTTTTTTTTTMALDCDYAAGKTSSWFWGEKQGKAREEKTHISLSDGPKKGPPLAIMIARPHTRHHIPTPLNSMQCTFGSNSQSTSSLHYITPLSPKVSENLVLRPSQMHNEWYGITSWRILSFLYLQPVTSVHWIKYNCTRNRTFSRMFQIRETHPRLKCIEQEK